MARRRTVVLALMAMFAAGCAIHWDVESFESPGANLAGKETFFWKGGAFATAAAADKAVLQAAESNVRSAVVEELTHKGFREVDAATGADIIVSYQVSGVRRFVAGDTVRVGAPSATTVMRPGEIQPPPASAVGREVWVRDGSVIVFLDDAGSGQLLWRGEVASETRPGSAEQAARVIAQMAREIAREVPARAGRT
jgi:hypothetical protein